MTALKPLDAALIAAYKSLATRLQDILPQHAPQATLGRTQALHIIAALHGVANWQTLLARPHRERLPDTPALVTLDRALAQRGVHVPAAVLPRLLDGLNPLTFTVLEENISDIPAKTTVTLSLLLHGPITPDPLRRLLLAEFERVSARTGFRYHAHPTSIFIWAYSSEAHDQGKAGHQAGMLQRSHADFQAGRPPKVTVDLDLIRAVQQPETVHFGLPEQTRRAIFRDHCRVTARARIATDEAHPVGPENTLETMRLNERYKCARLEEWNTLLAARHGLTDAQYHEVVVEGMTRYWPMTPMQDTATKTIP